MSISREGGGVNLLWCGVVWCRWIFKERGVRNHGRD